jgi:hypothetical protein
VMLELLRRAMVITPVMSVGASFEVSYALRKLRNA